MNFFLLALGMAATAAGCVMAGFGIPINAFSLGNTLIISGTVAISCGLILIALAAALGQLRRIAEALNVRSVAGAARAPGSIEALVPPTARMTPASPPSPPSPVPTRVPIPPKPMDMAEAFPPVPPTSQRPPEPRFPVASTGEPPGPLDWLRTKSRPGASSPVGPPVAEPPMVEVQDEAPLSPRPPPRPPNPAEPALEPKMWSAPGRAEGFAESRSMPRATPQPEPPKEPDVHQFDAVWDRPAPTPTESKREAKFDAQLSGVQRRDDRPAERRIETGAKPSERTPTILKSGVIDGMPYTLYADGSIEAQLPQGTLKFASVDALRAHLEKHA
jgi:hypothetical protein